MEPNPAPQSPRNKHIYLLPNLLTTCGMFAGFYAILAAASGRFEAAAVAIFIAAVFDGIDGRVARLTGTSSEFGVQYDSLADLVSFGMAPSLVMYHWALSSMKLDGTLLGKVGWALPSCTPPVRHCAWPVSTPRLARSTNAGSSA